MKWQCNVEEDLLLDNNCRVDTPAAVLVEAQEEDNRNETVVVSVN